jgi:hypothetical protein
MKMTTFWASPDVAGSEHLWNVNQFVPDYTFQHPRRQSSSEIGLMITMYDVTVYILLNSLQFGQVFLN